MTNFKVGDRIRLTADFAAGKGSLGTIVSKDDHNIMGCKFDNWRGGHSCGGKITEPGLGGYYLSPHDIELLTEENPRLVGRWAKVITNIQSDHNFACNSTTFYTIGRIGKIKEESGTRGTSGIKWVIFEGASYGITENQLEILPIDYTPEKAQEKWTPKIDDFVICIKSCESSNTGTHIKEGSIEIIRGVNYDTDRVWFKSTPYGHGSFPTNYFKYSPSSVISKETQYAPRLGDHIVLENAGGWSYSPYNNGCIGIIDKIEIAEGMHSWAIVYVSGKILNSRDSDTEFHSIPLMNREKKQIFRLASSHEIPPSKSISSKDEAEAEALMEAYRLSLEESVLKSAGSCEQPKYVSLETLSKIGYVCGVDPYKQEDSSKSSKNNINTYIKDEKSVKTPLLKKKSRILF